MGDRRRGARGRDFQAQLLAFAEAMGEGLPFESWGAPSADAATQRFSESLGALPLGVQIELDNLLHAVAHGPLPVPLQQVAFRDVARLAMAARTDLLGANPLHVRDQIAALAAYAESDAHTEVGAHMLLAQLRQAVAQAEA